MKKLYYNLVIFLGLVLPPLALLHYITQKGLQKSYFTSGCMPDIYNSRVNADLLFIGPSTTELELSPRIFDSTLKINSYNMGIAGQPFHLQKALFDIYIAHNRKPKTIVQCIGPFELAKARFLQL